MVINPERLRHLYTLEAFEEILPFLKDAVQDEFPEWNSHLDSDFGSVLLELYAGLTDMFRYYQNIHAVESFPTLARLRSSLIRHAKWLGYTPKPPTAARTTLKFTLTAPQAGTTTIPKGSAVSTSDGEIVFRTTEDLNILAGSITGEVEAIHGKYVGEEFIAVSTGQANQSYDLSQGPLVVLPTAGDESDFALTVTVDGDEWEHTRSLAWSSELGGGTGNAYRVDIEADDTARIVFGDGLYGNVPSQGVDIIASYWIGGGRKGNVGAGSLTRIQSTLPNVGAVTNIDRATGGHNRESNEDLRRNIPSQVATRGRAVTRWDYIRLIEALGEVAKVNVEHPSANIVNVYVLPQGGGVPSQALITSIGSYIDNIRMITEDVRILPPVVVPVNITARVWVGPGFNVTNVVSDVEQAIRDDLGQVEFARRLYPNDIYNTIQKVIGVSKVDVDLLDRDTGTDVRAIFAAPHEILSDGTITVNGEPKHV